MSQKLPAMPFYFGDWRKDLGVQCLTYEERGIWFELLGFMWESEDRGKLVLKGRAVDTEMAAALLGLPKQKVEQTFSKLLATGVAHSDQETGAIMSRRMIRDEETRQKRVIAGAVGGAKNSNPLKNKESRKNFAQAKPEQNTEDETENENEDENENDKKERVSGGKSVPVITETQTNASELYSMVTDEWLAHDLLKSLPQGPIYSSERACLVLVRDHASKTILGAIRNYGTILSDPSRFFYTTKHTLAKFLEKHVFQFFDAMDPLNNYRIKDDKKGDGMERYRKIMI